MVSMMLLITAVWAAAPVTESTASITGIEVWFDAIVTGILVAINAWPSAECLAFKADKVVCVAASKGSGSVAALTGWVV